MGKHIMLTGWSHHFVSKRKYHFIIPNDKDWNKPIDVGVLDLQTHLLHGLIHCNGFGHLLCVNGIEGGSSFIYGREVMDLWDRICTSLHSRLSQLQYINIFRVYKWILVCGYLNLIR